MRTVHHVAAEGKAREGVLHHIVYGIQPWVGTFKGGTLLGVDGTYLQRHGKDLAVHHPFYSHIAERMEVHIAVKMFHFTIITVRNIYVSLGVRRLSLQVVKILQCQLSTDRLRKEVHVKPSSHNTSEINQNRSVQLWLNRFRKQHIHDTVALKLLWRDPHLRKPHHCGRPPRCFPTRVKSFTPEVQRLPTVGITAEARRSLPCAVGDKKGVRMSVHLSTHHHLCYCWHIIYPSPPLP